MPLAADRLAARCPGCGDYKQHGAPLCDACHVQVRLELTPKGEAYLAATGEKPLPAA